MSAKQGRRYVIGGVDVTDEVRRSVDEAPPLSAAQLDQLRGLFGGDRPRPELALVQPAPPPVRQHVLYRWYDEEDVLLYIGITNNLKTRSNNHLGRSTWTEFAVRQDISERYDSREEVESAEREAIQRERPIFNVAHAPSGANTRMVEYLIQRGRVDLLVAKVGRA